MRITVAITPHLLVYVLYSALILSTNSTDMIQLIIWRYRQLYLYPSLVFSIITCTLYMCQSSRFFFKNKSHETSLNCEGDKVKIDIWYKIYKWYFESCSSIGKVWFLKPPQVLCLPQRYTLPLLSLCLLSLFL